ncbi:MAG: hypothetical protein ABIH66_03395 [bacterium]
MEKEKESRVASKLGDYVDGKDGISGPEWADAAADVATVNLLRLGFGEEAAADEVFTRRLRRELVEELKSRKVPHRWGPPQWALAAASILLLLVSGLLVQRGIRDLKMAGESGAGAISARAPVPDTSRETGFESAASRPENEGLGYRTAALSEGGGVAFHIEPFTGISERRIERIDFSWRESRLEAVFERHINRRSGL